MKWSRLLFLLVGVGMAETPAQAFTTELYYHPEYECGYTSMEAKYSSAGSQYKFAGFCTKSGIRVPWSSQGEFSSQGGIARERIALNGNPPYRGMINTKLLCTRDPWTTSPPFTKYNLAPCAQGQFGTTGEVSSNQELVEFLATGFMHTQLPNTTGFAYSRSALNAQVRADLEAEKAALAQAEAARVAQEAARKEAQRLQQAAQPAPTFLEGLAPYVTSPTAGSLYLSMTAVPIKLAPPPRRMTVTLYTVKIERKDPKGTWAMVTTLPISPAQASSPSGYLGWGAGGPDGRSLPLMASPGTYRISAQVSGPQQTGWSQGVEFVVTAPNKAIQRAPKGFGP